MCDIRIFCNACGKELYMENNILKEDAFEAKKQWGYFSKKDTKMHSFVLCEECYDKMISRFVIPAYSDGCCRTVIPIKIIQRWK